MEVEERGRRMSTWRSGNLWVPLRHPAGIVVGVNLEDEEGDEVVAVVAVVVEVEMGRDLQREAQKEGQQEIRVHQDRKQGRLGSEDLWDEAEMEVLSLVHHLLDDTLQ